MHRSLKVFGGLFIMHDVILIAIQIYRPKLQQMCPNYNKLAHMTNMIADYIYPVATKLQINKKEYF